MRIGELAEQAGVNPTTVRYYEDIGVLPEPDRTTAGYRRYSDADVDRLVFVRRSQQLGLHLDEIREILALREQGRRPCRFVVEVATHRLAEIDQRIAAMRCARDELADLLANTEPLDDDAGGYCQLIEHTQTSDG